MRNLKSIIAAASMLLASSTAMAQTTDRVDESSSSNVKTYAVEASKEGGYLAESQELGYMPYPHAFIQVQGGLGTTFTDVSCWKLLSPTFSVGVGGMFTPIIGARLHVNGWKSKGGFDNYKSYSLTPNDYFNPDEPYDQHTATSGKSSKVLKYDYNYINTDIDLMVNVFNIFTKRVHRPFDLYLIAGVGLNYAWHNNEFEDITSKYQVESDISNAWGKKQTPRHNLLSHNLRLGLLADVNIGKNFSVGAEVDFNSLDDRFNSKYTNSDDWMMTAQLSLTYKFGHKKAPKPNPGDETTTSLYQNTNQSEVAPATAPTPVVKAEPVSETIFYAIRESDVNQASILDKVATWCKKYPNKTVTISGYADKGTGNPTLNAGYAQQRAEKAAAYLQQKGVPASQMVIKSYGDTVQPFPSDNDKNRCVIIEGK